MQTIPSVVRSAGMKEVLTTIKRVGIEVNACSAENADITFWYGSHQDRLAIEKVMRSDTFFGIPYNLQNP
jgi:hypothetical protein